MPIFDLSLIMILLLRCLIYLLLLFIDVKVQNTLRSINLPPEHINSKQKIQIALQKRLGQLGKSVLDDQLKHHLLNQVTSQGKIIK